jgi:hypothetical protein
MKQKDPKYKQVENHWYTVLKNEGFQDIEDSKTGMLKEWDFNFFRNQFNLIDYSTTVLYYEKAKQLLLFHPFKDDTHKTIWELHCDGLSERKIAQKVKKYKKSMVHYIISSLARTLRERD